MTTALAERPVDVTSEQLDLIKRTVANGATDAELKLFLFDCARRGVHPLDKLLHFTKRGGKYTPVTSIDFMRSQAAMTGEMAGSDDAVINFTEDDAGKVVWASASATVTVYRLTQGQRYAYSATARWAEYYPGEAGGSMWRKMPNTMLGKCAEALALRKAFPQQLAGLYAREEMEQASEPTGYAVVAPEPGQPAPSAVSEGYAATQHGEEIPADGKLYIARVSSTPTNNANVTKTLVCFSDGTQAGTIKKPIAALAEQLCQDREPVRYTSKTSRWGEDLLTLDRADVKLEEPALPLKSDEIAF